MDYSKTVAVVGLGGIFPGADTPDQLWENIKNRVNSSGLPPEGRWPVPCDKAYSSVRGRLDRVVSKKACFVKGFRLSPEGLDIDPILLEKLDPLFHYLLYAGKEAFFDARTGELDRKRVGIIVGNIALPTGKASALAVEYLGKNIEEGVKNCKVAAYPVHPLNRYVTGLPAGILAKSLGLGGGTMTLDAACASSLYAISLASEKLLAGKADAMLAGGVSRPDSFYTQMGFSQLHALSPDGVSSPFDVSGNGLVVGEGAGLFLLKRAEDAFKQNDRIYALLRGTGLSNDVDGGLLAPDSDGQIRAMRKAYMYAGISPADIDLVECHATGTPIGDSVEFQSLERLWGEHEPGEQKCVLGSVKSNIGHLLTAAGAAGLMKVLLSLKHKELPPTANFKTPAKGIPLSGSSFRVLKEPEPWSPGKKGLPRRAAVSAFGFGGINAHLIVEEFINKPAAPGRESVVVGSPVTREPIAVVGMDADFGKWDSLDKFTRRVLGMRGLDKAAPRENCRGVEKSDYCKRAGLDSASFNGFFKKEVKIPSDTFRIPPKELKEMLPQQSLMLKVASGAIKDAGIVEKHLSDTGVFIGIALDMNTTNFHLRWRSEHMAEKWAEEAGLNLSGEELKEWSSSLKEASGEPLTANRTIGSLGSIIASRIAREFKLGGPAFTVSSEETSAFSAIDTAISLIRQGSISQAVVGAVDLPGDVRSLLATRRLSSGKEGTVCGEGAGAVVLKRLSDAEKDGDRIYAVIRGVGFASGGSVESNSTDKYACFRAAEDAYKDASLRPGSAGFIEAYRPDSSEDDGMEASALSDFYKVEREAPDHFKKIPAGSVMTDIGNTQAASGIAGIIKTCLSLFHRIIPGSSGAGKESLFSGETLFNPSAPQYWLHNSAEGNRVSGVAGVSTSGNAGHIVLEGAGDNGKSGQQRLFVPKETGLFVIRGKVLPELRDELGRFEKFFKESSILNMDRLAGLWFHTSGNSSQKGSTVSFIANSFSDLKNKIYEAGRLLREGDLSDSTESGGVFLNLNKQGDTGKLAFVYPGSGNHFFGMGREISFHFSDILRIQERESRYLKSQYLPEFFWNNCNSKNELSASTAALLGQVAAGTLFTDLLMGCGIRPDAVIGYSLGETTGFFSLRAWRDRDGMLKRIIETPLFKDQLAGEFHAARKKWKTSGTVHWAVGLVDRAESEVLKSLEKRERVYLLIVNTPKECIIGGEKRDVEEVSRELGANLIMLKDVTIAHCDVVETVKNAYRELHLFKTSPPDGVSFYSGASGKTYPLNRESAADSVLNHALHGINFPDMIRQAYKDGVRVFVEPGPGMSCSRMIGEILLDKPHTTVALSVPGVSEVDSFLTLLARLIAGDVPVDLSYLYGARIYGQSEMESKEKSPRFIVVDIEGKPFDLPSLRKYRANSIPSLSPAVSYEEAGSNCPESVTAENEQHFLRSGNSGQDEFYGRLIASMRETSALRAGSHEQFLNFSAGVSAAMEKNLSFRMDILKKLELSGDTDAYETPSEIPVRSFEKNGPVFLDRSMCMEFAVGRIGSVLGPEFTEIDTFPTRVRLPDEPLMLVDRIISVEGTALSMTGGRVVTEHDIHAGSWYLDCNRIPACIAVESGQADLFLSGFLGIDFKTRGEARYRLLDAVVTFHQEMPGPGKTIRYDIKIDHFFRQGETYLFRFAFEASVEGKPLLTMREGCAGFFSRRELDAGRGIIKSSIEKRIESELKREQAEKILPMSVESYSARQIDALRRGELAMCFGKLFSSVQVKEPVVIPGERMALVRRVTRIDPDGGRFGQGMVRGEADIRADDWFLTCHFVDDMVMPGTLMFECCLHTLRIYLLRMGWVCEKGEVTVEPVPGVASRLKCRGQVTQDSKVVAYEIYIKETGYRPEPYAIVDALMFADEKPIVEITDMSIRFCGTDREKILKVWDKGESGPETKRKNVLYDNESILAFSNGNPSEAFGDRYRVFDKDRAIARLPGPPYKFLDRITDVKGGPWVMKEGHSVEAEYDVPENEWYFKAHRQGTMPFSVLLEIALQPCGWLAAYMGSALTSETDLRFRNLGGSATQYSSVFPEAGTLTARVKCAKVSSSAGMIIQNYDFEVFSRGKTLYKGDTYFGFFTADALKNQVGIRESATFDLSDANNSATFPYSEKPPFPEKSIRMIDGISLFLTEAEGAYGFVEGVKRVDPDEWFFKAHFYQDPVCPGSLGLESFLQLVRLYAERRWGGGIKNETLIPGEKHEWLYRGQIIPEDSKVTVQARIDDVDDSLRRVRATGCLSVDGRLIYQMKSFGVQYE